MERKTYEFGEFRVDAGQFRVTKAGDTLDLEPKAIEVLLFLIEHRERLVLKEELLDAVWKDTFVTPNALTRVIAQLRKALDDDAQEARIIETVPRKGYRFLPEIRIASLTTESLSASTTRPEPTSTSSSADAATVKAIALDWRLVLAASMLLVVAVGAWAWRRTPATPPLALTEIVQVTAASGYEAEPALSADGRRLAYVSDESGAMEIYVRPLGEGNTLQVTRDGAQNDEPAWSPDGESIAYHSQQKGGIWVVPASGGAPRLVAKAGSDPSWSPDGSTIALSTYEGALAEQATLITVAAAGGEPKPLTRAGTPRGGHRKPAWSHDGRWIAFHGYDGAAGSSIWMIPTSGGGPIRLAEAAIASDVAFAPDDRAVCWSGPGPGINLGLWCVSVNGTTIGRPVAVLQGVAGIDGLSIARDGTLAYGVKRNDADLWSVPLSSSTGTPNGAPTALMHDTNRNTHPMFSPDGSKLSFLNWRPGTPSELWLMDMATLRSELLVAGKGAEFYGSWFPDNRRVLAMSVENNRRRPVRVSIDTRQVEEMTNLPKVMANLMLSPDGRDLAYHVPGESGSVTPWRVSIDGGEPFRLAPASMSAGYPAWAPDGKRLAIEVAEGRNTQIWIVNRDGSGLHQLTSGEGQHWPHSWAPDNDRIAYAGTKDGSWDVWSVSASTGAVQQLTKFPRAQSYVRYPAWSPRNDRIVFEYSVTTGNLWTARLTGSTVTN
jgi:Tol biopolymer transport system component/DNA-binding winged helix-turn-helix (wHTH) protein